MTLGNIFHLLSKASAFLFFIAYKSSITTNTPAPDLLPQILPYSPYTKAYNMAKMDFPIPYRFFMFQRDLPQMRFFLHFVRNMEL